MVGHVRPRGEGRRVMARLILLLALTGCSASAVPDPREPVALRLAKDEMEFMRSCLVESAKNWNTGIAVDGCRRAVLAMRSMAGAR